MLSYYFISCVINFDEELEKRSIKGKLTFSFHVFRKKSSINLKKNIRYRAYITEMFFYSTVKSKYYNGRKYRET